MATTAARQHGAVARWQLREAGLSDRQIDHARSRGLLHPVHRAVVAFGSPRLDGTGRWWAALLACGGATVIGYRSAAALWCLRPSSSAATEVIVPSTSRPAHDGVRVHRHPTMAADETTLHDGLPVTTVARTLLDLASVLSAYELRRAIAQAEILHLFDLGAVETLLLRHPRHGGHLRLAAALVDWSPPATVRSNLETAFLDLCVRRRLPRPVMNGEVLGMEVDASFPDHGVAVELDGGAAHTGVIKREDDYAKRAELTAAGWCVLSYTYRQVTARNGTAVLETLVPVLRERGPRIGGASPRR